MALLHETDIDRVHGMLPYVKRPQRSLNTTTVESSHDQS